MKQFSYALFCGLIFGTGLVVSGMINPSKVKGFLDLFGHWDFSLAFVMGGAVGFNLLSFKWAQKKTPWLSSQFFLPSRKDIDGKLLIGSSLFGIGWGLLGICPGPAIVNLATVSKNVFLFVGFMLLGMILFYWVEKGILRAKK